MLYGDTHMEPSLAQITRWLAWYDVLPLLIVSEVAYMLGQHLNCQHSMLTYNRLWQHILNLQLYASHYCLNLTLHYNYSTMNKFLQSILVALLVPPAVGWDPSQRDCSDIPLCLTSFKWCDSKGDEGCYFPDGVYKPSLAPGNVIYALVLENRNYTISWKVYPNNQDIPVRVQWPLGENATWETSK